MPLYSEKTERFPSRFTQPMLTREAPFMGGMGNVVPGGGAEITGVFVLVASLLLQATDNIRQQRTTARFLCALGVPLRLKNRSNAKNAEIRRDRRVSDLRVFDRGSFILFLGERFTGDSIFTFNPPAEIYKLTPLRTEGTKKIVFPLDRLTAGWTFHET